MVTSGYGRLQAQSEAKCYRQTFIDRVGIIYIHLDHHCYDHSRQVIIIFLLTTRVVLTRSPYVLGPYLETCYRRRAEPRARKQISGPSPFILSCYNSWDILLLRLRQAHIGRSVLVKNWPISRTKNQSSMKTKFVSKGKRKRGHNPCSNLRFQFLQCNAGSLDVKSSPL